ncbi:hypothetical protein, partial [uncultured Fibrobacter sp.]|uniref:hypothetical protein n=1 Tax=uncultured Fibrobacter sp. TaxID=261512 RepID=UPI0025FD5595
RKFSFFTMPSQGLKAQNAIKKLKKIKKRGKCKISVTYENHTKNYLFLAARKNYVQKIVLHYRFFSCRDAQYGKRPRS